MKAIFLVNGVYVCIDDDRSYKREVEEEQTFIVSESGRCVLFGGRVVVDGKGSSYYGGYYYTLRIDGIELYNFESGSSYPLSEDFYIEAITAYLNQMEQLGVDTFLCNYKEAAKCLKNEVSSLSCKLEAELQVREDKEKESSLKRLRKIIDGLIGLLFLLSINMNAGIDNHTYINAYDECENIISQYIKD